MAVVRRSTVYVGSAREASSLAVLVYGRAPKVASCGSCDMYSFALSGRVMGLQCVALLILKELQIASYRASGMRPVCAMVPRILVAAFVWVVCVVSVLL